MDWHILDSYYLLTKISATAINIMLAWSVYLGFMSGTVSLCQAAFFGIGAYAAASLTMVFGWHLVTAVVASALITAMISLMISLPMLRLKGLYLTIATLALAEVGRVALHNIRYGREIEFAVPGQQAEPRWIGPNGNLGFDYITYLRDNGISVGEYAAWIVLLVTILGILFFFLERSRLAYAMRAVAADEIAAQSIGLNHRFLKVFGFTLGATLAGAAGGLNAHLLTYLRATQFGITENIVALAYVIIGGGQTFWGPAVGASILTFLPEITQFTKDYRVAIIGVFMLLITILRPHGLVTRTVVAHAAHGRNLRPRNLS